MIEATDAIGKLDGQGIPTVKPWDPNTIREKMELVRKSGAFAVAMDIDAAGLPFLQNLNPPAGSKSVEELRESRADGGNEFSNRPQGAAAFRGGYYMTGCRRHFS